jgi:hypothetical protein
LIAREIDHVLRCSYDFLNHCCPRALRQRYRRKPSRKRSVQRSNFTGEIEVDGAMHCVQSRTHFLNSAACKRSPYSHFFHVKNRYGPIAASSIATSA